jgi:hypothetical protein
MQHPQFIPESIGQARGGVSPARSTGGAMTRAIVGLSILAIIVTCWALIAQTLDERPDPAALQWASQMSRPDRDPELSDDQYRLLGLQSMTGDPIELGRVIAVQGRLEPHHPDAFPLLDSTRLDPLLRCETLHETHCALIPSLLAKYQPMLEHYDALPIDMRLPFSHLIGASEILVMAQSLSKLRVFSCLNENEADCGHLLRNELIRTRERIARAEYHLERLIGIVLFNRMVEFVVRLDNDSNRLLHSLELPGDFFASALSLDIVRQGIKQEFGSQLLTVDMVAEMAGNEWVEEEWVDTHRVALEPSPRPSSRNPRREPTGPQI